MKGRKNAYYLIFGMIIGTAVMVWSFVFGLKNIRTNTNQTTSPQKQEEQPTIENPHSIIEGSLSFPSESIPKDMEVCAEDLSGEEIVCTTNQISDTKFEYGIGYRLKIEKPGKYFVFARVASYDPSYKAYYSEFVTCGLSYDCPSHEPIAIDVVGGEVVSGISPSDWYSN